MNRIEVLYNKLVEMIYEAEEESEEKRIELVNYICSLMIFNPEFLKSPEVFERLEVLVQFNNSIIKILENIRLVGEKAYITNNLLDLSQLDNKDFTLQKDLLNLIEILQDSIKAREKVAKEQNIKIDLKISLAKEIILFTGDKNRLKQMFCETLDKALQIYPQKSDLIIKILEDDNNYYIYMQNNNDEISVEHLPEMFPQFYQTAEDDTILNSIELKIAQHLASLHQIKLTTEKQSDKYTVFKFTISK